MLISIIIASFSNQTAYNCNDYLDFFIFSKIYFNGSDLNLFVVNQEYLKVFMCFVINRLVFLRNTKYKHVSVFDMTMAQFIVTWLVDINLLLLSQKNIKVLVIIASVIIKVYVIILKSNINQSNKSIYFLLKKRSGHFLNYDQCE